MINQIHFPGFQLVIESNSITKNNAKAKHNKLTYNTGCNASTHAALHQLLLINSDGQQY